MPLRPLMPEEMDELSALPQPAAQPRISPLGPPPVDLPPPEMGTPPRPFTVGQTDLSTYQMPPVGSPFFRGEAARPGIPSSLRPLTPQEFDEMRNRVAPSSIRLQEPPSAPFGAEQAALLREEANRPPGVEGRPLDALARRPGWEDPATSTTSRIMDPLRTGAVGVRTAGIGIGLNARAATVDRINQILEGAPPVPGEMADGLRNMPPAALARLRDRLISEMGTGAQTSENLNQTLEAETIQAPLAVQQMMEAGKRGDNSGVLSAIWSDPGNVIAYLGLSSLPYSAATAAGGIVAGAPGAFAGSAMLEYGGSLMERLREHWGVDTRNRDAVVAALTNPVIARDVRWFGATRGTAIGALDAAAFGGTAAGFRGVANQAGRQSAMRTFGEGLRETGVGTVREGALGGAGEALAQVATGQPLDPGQIAAEALGETAGAVVSVPAAAARGVAQGFAERGGGYCEPARRISR